MLLLSFLILALVSVFILTILNSPQNAPVTSGSPEEEPDSLSETVDTPQTEAQNEIKEEGPSESPLEPQPTPSGPVFVIPENPSGTIGVLIASTLAILIFALKKKNY